MLQFQAGLLWIGEGTRIYHYAENITKFCSKSEINAFNDISIHGMEFRAFLGTLKWNPLGKCTFSSSSLSVVIITIFICILWRSFFFIAVFFTFFIFIFLRLLSHCLFQRWNVWMWKSWNNFKRMQKKIAKP